MRSPGIGVTAAQDLLAEIGTGTSRFPTRPPGVLGQVRAPARQSSGPAKAATTGQGNPWLGGTLGEAATGAARIQDRPSLPLQS
jgi:hypothetical protein